MLIRKIYTLLSVIIIISNLNASLEPKTISLPKIPIRLICDPRLCEEYLTDELNLKLHYHSTYEIITDNERADFNKVQNTNKCIIKQFKQYETSKLIIVS